MQIETLRFGLLEIEQDNIIYFPQGLPGFEQNKNYTLLQPDPELPLSYLQSVDDGYISFVIIDPFLVNPTYEFELSEAVKKELQLQETQDVSILSIVTIKDEMKHATLNLKAPLVINVRERLGKQIILHDHDYSTRHPLFAEKQPESTEAGRG